MTSHGTSRAAGSRVLRIHATTGWPAPDLRELWEHHELLYFLVWRTVKVRYRQTVLGGAWVILQPFLTMVVFSVFFGRLGRLSSEGIPYAVFSYAALVPWTYFANALGAAGNSLVENERLIAKVYFPRLLLPLAAVLAGLVDLAVSGTVLVGLMLAYGIAPTAAICTLPLFVLLASLTAFAVGLWLSAWNVRFRDVRHATPFLIQFWLFLTPIAYSSTIVPRHWQALYALNPMVGVVEGFRWALLGTTRAPGPSLGVSLAVVVATLVLGLYHFRRMEGVFVDVV